MRSWGPTSLDAATARRGTHFAVWAPNAREVSVIGEFNGWNPARQPARARGMIGVWAGLRRRRSGTGTLYKYSIVAPDGGSRFDKADPYAFAAERAPGTASKVWDLAGYEWGDAGLDGRTAAARQSLTAPDRDLRGPSRLLDARARGGQPLAELPRARPQAGRLCRRDGLHARRADARRPSTRSTAVLGLPAVGYFAPTGRFGTPHDLMFLVDTLHRRGIGRDPRLGPRPLRPRPARPRRVRRHATLRARRPRQAAESAIWNTYASTTRAPRSSTS